MAKNSYLSLDDDEAILKISQALNNPTRIQILKLLSHGSYSITDISRIMNIPQSTTVMHMKCLENADLLLIENIPGFHGIKKVCTKKNDDILLTLNSVNKDIDYSYSVEMPVGAFTDADIYPPCGLCTEHESLSCEDTPSEFFHPNRFKAQLLWTGKGFVEYKFPLPDKYFNNIPKSLMFTFECCSEAPRYNENWPSDLTLWINGKECVNWQTPGDFGARMGRYTPSWWNIGGTQYGLLYVLEINENGTFLNNKKQCYDTIMDYSLSAPQKEITIRIGIKEDAKHIGGFNLFGRSFGDYNNDMILTLSYPNMGQIRRHNKATICT